MGHRLERRRLEEVVKKAIEVVDVLERHGVVKSIFFKWSGRGAHIHINPRAFSPELLERIDPLDVAYSVTQYIALKIEPEDGVVVENKIDAQRFFTAPQACIGRLVVVVETSIS